MSEREALIEELGVIYAAQQREREENTADEKRRDAQESTMFRVYCAVLFVSVVASGALHTKMTLVVWASIGVASAIALAVMQWRERVASEAWERKHFDPVRRDREHAIYAALEAIDGNGQWCGKKEAAK